MAEDLKISILDGEVLVSNPDGEVVTGKLRVASKPKTIAPYREYIIVNKETDFSFLKSASDLRLLEKLRHKLGYENEIQLNQTYLAGELGMSRQQLWRSMNHLIELGIVERNLNENGIRMYRMNHELMWRGKAVNQRKAVAEKKAN